MAGRFWLLALVFVAGIAIASLMPGVPQTLRKITGLAPEPGASQSQRQPRDDTGNLMPKITLTEQSTTAGDLSVERS